MMKYLVETHFLHMNKICIFLLVAAMIFCTGCGLQEEIPDDVCDQAEIALANVINDSIWFYGIHSEFYGLEGKEIEYKLYYRPNRQEYLGGKFIMVTTEPLYLPDLVDFAFELNTYHCRFDNTGGSNSFERYTQTIEALLEDALSGNVEVLGTGKVKIPELHKPSYNSTSKQKSVAIEGLSETFSSLRQKGTVYICDFYETSQYTKVLFEGDNGTCTIFYCADVENGTLGNPTIVDPMNEYTAPIIEGIKECAIHTEYIER